jgi:hypothetical protein
MSKYEPLPRFLASQEVPKFRIAFQQIEDILGFKLPKSAYEYEAWWSNNATGHSHARTWLAAGWKVEDLDLVSRQVTFTREMSEPNTRRRSDPWGCMAGSVTIMPGTDLTAPSGEPWNAEKGLLLNE